MAIEMNEKQEELYAKLKPLQKEISLNSLAGMNDIDCYRNSKGKAKTESAQRAGVSEILANPNVEAFLACMKEKAVEKALVTTADIVRRMWEEGNDFQEGTSQSGRVSALKALTDFTGGFDNNKQKIETKEVITDNGDHDW